VDDWIWLGSPALSVSAAVDLTISASLSYCLWTRRKDIFKQWVAWVLADVYSSDQVNSAQKVIDKLILFTVRKCCCKPIVQTVDIAPTIRNGCYHEVFDWIPYRQEILTPRHSSLSLAMLILVSNLFGFIYLSWDHILMDLYLTSTVYNV
jgi:hypothetical protein